MNYEEARARREWQKEAECAGQVADNMDVRKALMARVHAGEVTLEEAQRLLKAIKRSAKKNGQITRNQAWMGRRP